METTIFKRAYQALFISMFGAGLFARIYFGSPSISWVETLAQHSWIPCVFHSLTGYDCPGCGMTRALISLLLGSPKLSFYFHPLGPLLGFTICYLFLLSLTGSASWNLNKLIPKKYGVSLLLIILSWGVLRNF